MKIIRCFPPQDPEEAKPAVVEETSEETEDKAKKEEAEEKTKDKKKKSKKSKPKSSSPEPVGIDDDPKDTQVVHILTVWWLLLYHPPNHPITLLLY